MGERGVGGASVLRECECVVGMVGVMGVHVVDVCDGWDGG